MLDKFPEGAQILEHPRQLDHWILVGEVLQKLGIARIIDSHGLSHGTREVTTGQCVEALVCAILSGEHTLSGVAQTMASFEMDLILGNEVDPLQFHDDRLGRALDQVFKSGLSQIQSSILLSLIKQYDVDLSLLHTDTTTVSVHGDYSAQQIGDPDDPNSAPFLTHGYSKDRRPDLKQFVISLTTTHGDALPIFGRATAGNRSDVKENQFTLNQLKKILPETISPTLVADCKMFTKENLRRASDLNFNLITLIPRSLKIWSDIFDKHSDRIGEFPLIQRKVNRIDDPGREYTEFDLEESSVAEWFGKADSVVYNYDLDGQGYSVPLKVVIVRSSELEKSKTETITKAAEKECKSLENASAKLAKREFKCREDALAAGRKHSSRKATYHRIDFSVKEEVKQLKTKTKTIYRVSATVIEVADKRQAEIIRQSCFILAFTGEGPIAAPLVLRLYKGQIHVESAFRWAKAVTNVAPIFLNKNTRIASLTLVYVIAYLVRSLIQREVRLALKREGKTTPGHKNRGRSHKPTAEVIATTMTRLFAQRIELPGGKEVFWLFNLTTEKAAILEYLNCKVLEREDVIYTIRKPGPGEGGYEGLSIIERQRRKREQRRRREK